MMRNIEQRRVCGASRSREAGMTLLELAVVLAILVAVAGIIVPLLPNMMHQANVPACTANITELDKMIQTQSSMYSTYPNRMDNLTGGSGLVSYVLTGATGKYGQASFTADTLSGSEATALTNAGITQLTTLVEKPSGSGDWKPTFWPYGTSQGSDPTFISVGNGTSVAVLTSFGCRLMGLPYSNNPADSSGTNTHNRFVVFGLGRPCTLFRSMAMEPPSHFADAPSEDPATYYMRFAAVFQVAKDMADAAGNWSVVPLTESRARFVGTVAFHDFGLATGDSHNKEWWDYKKEERQ